VGRNMAELTSEPISTGISKSREKELADVFGKGTFVEMLRRPVGVYLWQR